MSLLTFVGISCLLSLGFWQLHRAAQKKQMLAAASHQQHKPAVWWQPDGSLPIQYQKIQLQGRYSQHSFLLDNQFYNHQFGYHVLTALELDNNSIILVDRGWIAAHRTRTSFPLISTPTSVQTIRGQVYYPNSGVWILGQNLDEKSADLAVIEKFDQQIIGDFLHKTVYPFIIRLDSKDKNGYVREWPIIAMTAERHIGYAVQWFAMAAVLLIIFLGLNRNPLK